MKTTVFWSQVDPVTKVSRFGFTRDFLNETGTIWNLIPTQETKVTKGSIIFSMESCRKLLPIKSPLSGTIVQWGEKVLTPDKINETDVVFIFHEETT